MSADIAALERSVYLKSAARDFVELTIIKLLAKHTNQSHAAVARTRNSSGRVLDLIEKNAVAVGATTDAGSIGILQNLAQAFLQSLGLFSAFDTILNAGGFKVVPLRTRIFSVTLAASAYMVGEAIPKPIAKLQLAKNDIQYWKTVGISVVTAELLKSISSAAVDFIANELRRSVGAVSDQTFVNLLLQNTGTASVASAGTTAANFLTDLANALKLITYGANSRLYLLVPPDLDRRLITMRDSGGWIMQNDVVGDDINIVVSDQLSVDAILLDASQICAASGDVTIDQSSQTSLMLDDNPAGGPVGHLTSMFQAGLVAAKAERFFGAEILRNDAACLITGVSTTA